MAFLKLTQVTEKETKSFLHSPVVELSYRRICIVEPETVKVIYKHDLGGIPVTGISFASGCDYYFQESFDDVIRLVRDARIG